MPRRLPSSPPNLPGFSYIHILGSGGFADVFLYEQNMPRRKVAVKVLVTDVVSSRVTTMFQAEAHLMAQLSAHPSILTVHEAGVAADGRPYIVMELCSSELNERYRAAPLPVPEVLRIAVKIGSAVETAHRAGVLHRDIKPSNILTTAYGHPVLADFGIASTLGGGEDGGGVGLSIPWSAPEVVRGRTAGTIASEVWALGATIYSLLAARSPFEIPNGVNDHAALVSRIGRARVRAVGRPDVPRSLDVALSTALATDPDARQGSVLELITQLQAIEVELGFAQTAVDVAVDGWGSVVEIDLDDRTAFATDGQRRRRPRLVAGEWRAADRAADRTGIARNAADSDDGRPGARSSGWGRLTISLVIGCAALTIVLAALTVLVVLGSGARGGAIPSVGEVDVRAEDGALVFSWGDPGLGSGDSYVVEADDGTSSTQRSARFVVRPGAGAEVCITVAVNRDGRLGEPSGSRCGTAPGAEGR